MKYMHKILPPGIAAASYILLLTSCGGKTEAYIQPASAFRTANQAAVAAPIGEDDFSGKGGADTGLPSERPGTTQGESDKTPELFYSAYTVKKGDIVGDIAKKHGLSQDAIISLNKLRNTRTLQVGGILKLPSIDGILYTVKKGDTPEKIADKYRVSLEKLALVNNITDNFVPAGSVIFLPDAKLDSVTIREINGDLFHRPLHGGYYISSRYGWRDNPFSGYRTFHNGMDMATARGTSIYAALEGTVVDTGYDVTFGNYVIISHHSGYQTLYGHMTTILTSPGRHVTTATKIGTVGNTGQSTGPHLHFTVFKNHSTINPSSLLN